MKKELDAFLKKEDNHDLDEEEVRPYWINLGVRKFTCKQKKWGDKRQF